MRRAVVLLLALGCGGQGVSRGRDDAPVEPARRTPRPPPPATEPDASTPTLCDQRLSDDRGPLELDAAQAAARHGLIVSHFADITSSKETPVEVCGIDGELFWLTNTTCADGSLAFRDFPTAHAARTGNVGFGGRCDDPIDHYAVPCPEATYDVYMDLSMCGPGEVFR